MAKLTIFNILWRKGLETQKNDLFFPCHLLNFANFFSQSNRSEPRQLFAVLSFVVHFIKRKKILVWSDCLHGVIAFQKPWRTNRGADKEVFLPIKFSGGRVVASFHRVTEYTLEKSSCL